MAGGKIDILIEPDTKQFVPKMEAGLKGALGAAGKLGAALGVAAGGAEMAKTVVQVGQEFESQLNTMRAVSQATGEQLEAVTQRARELGNDTSLTATSASDAAAAMTELAKGGFSVEESMQAAKGTLQLASAAQTDAATAATIQSQALQAFSLQAEDAARVSDILAGAANASSAEIGDVAAALQQSGTVASQFGVSIEDTATAIAMFANAGITGSDAGTLLKSALLALTDQGKPAQKAIEELGLTVYDAQGKFVGLPELMGQLKRASAEMTPEAYQSATAILFGSDAMRMAGVAAQQGKEGFDELSTAVTRQGQAAEVAAAQTNGLPVAMERLQNTVEDVALGTYEALSGTLVAGVDAATAAIGAFGGFTEDAISGLKAAASAAGDFFAPMRDEAQAAGNVLQGLAGPIMGATGAFLALKKLDLPAHFEAVKVAGRDFSEEMRLQTTLAAGMGKDLSKMEAGLAAIEARYPAMRGMGNAFRETGKPLRTLGRNTKLAAVEMTGISRATAIARGNLLLLGGTARGVAAGGFSLLKSGVKGVVGALGGPFNVALMGGAAFIGAFVQSARTASEIQDRLAEASRDAAQAQDELRSAVAGTTGALNEQGLAAAGKLATTSMAELTAVGEKLNGTFDVIQAPDMSIWAQGFWNKDFNEYRSHVSETKDAYDALKAAAGELKIPMEDLGRVVAEGGPQFEQLMSYLQGGGEASQNAARQLQGVRDEIVQSVADAQSLDAGFVKISDGVRELAESGDDADKKLSGLRKALQGMGMLPETAQQAMLEFAKEVDKVAESQQGVADKSKAMGDALVDTNGVIQGTDENAQNLNDSMVTLRDAYIKNVAAGSDANEAYERMRVALESIGREYGLTGEQIEAMAQKYGMVPEVVSTLVKVDGASQAQQDVVNVWGALRTLPAGQKIEIEAPTDQARQALEQLGITVENIPGSTKVNVSASTDEARQALDDVVNLVATVGNQEYTVDMILDTRVLEGSAAEAEQILAALDGMHPTPEANIIIDKLKSGTDISVGELNYLASQTPTPVADLDDKLVNSKADTTASKLNEIHRMPVNPTADLNTGPADAKISGLKTRLEGLCNWFSNLSARASSGAAAHPTGTGFIRGHATGGRLPTEGPGTDRVDGFLGINAEGMPLARVDAGEWIINRRSSDRYSKELAAINAGVFPKLPGYADGGKIDDDAPGSVPTVAEVLAFAEGKPSRGQQASRSLTGAPYVRGGVDWGDCSGAVSGIARFAAGLAAFAGRFSTVTEQAGLAALGFLPGLGDPATSLNVGWHNNVAAYGDGHTAATAGGTNLEMGGSYGGGMIGGSVGADHPSFDKHAHLPLADASGLESAEIVSTSVDGVTLSAGGGKTEVSWGAAGKTFDIISSLFGTKLYDQGGLLPHGGMALNLSGLPEPVLTAGQWADLSAFTRSMQQVAVQLPAVVDGFRRASENLDATAAGLEAIAPKGGGRSIADAPGSAMDIIDDLTNSFKVAAGNFHASPLRFGLNVGGAIMPEVFGGLRDAERGLNDTRQAAKDGLVEIADREQELAEARAALAELDAKEGGYDKDTKRKIEDAEKAVARAREGGKADKIADAEEKLRRAREDAAEKLSEQDKKHAKDRDKAADTVMKAEKNLNTARTQTAQLAAEIGAGEITIAIEAAKAVYNLGKTVYETVKKVADWIIDKINAVEAARVETLSQSADMLAKLAQGVDQAREKLTQLRMNAVNALLAEQQAQWQLGQARTNFTQTQLRGIVDVANARAKLTNAELSSLRVIGTSVDDLWARTQAGLENGKLTFGETVESVSTAIQNKLALEADVHKSQAEALKANADAAVQLLDSSKAATKAALQARSATVLLGAQAGRLKAMTQLGDGSVSTPQAMRMQRITQLLAESADWTARDRREVKVEESRRYERAAEQAKVEAMRLLKEYFGEDENYGKYRAEVLAVMDRADDYGFWNKPEDAKKVIEAALKDTSFGRAVQALETQQVERQIAEYQETLAQTQVNVATTAIDAEYAPKEQQLRGEQAAAASQSAYFDAAAQFYRADAPEVKKTLSDFMDFSKQESTRLAETSGRQVEELTGIAQSARDIYDTLNRKPLDYELPGVQALPPSRVPEAWSKEIAAALGEDILDATAVQEVATRVVAAVDTPQVSTRYSTREEVEQARRDRDAAVATALDRELAAKRAEMMDLQLDRRFTALERSVAPQVTISFPDVEYVKTEDVAREMRDGLTKMGARVTVLEGRNGANYYKTRMG